MENNIRLTFLKKIYLILTFGFIYFLYETIEKYSFSEHTLAFIIAYFIIGFIFFVLPIIIYNKFKKSKGYVDLETIEYESPDGKNVVAIKKDIAKQIFVFLNQEIIFNGDKEFGLLNTPTSCSVAWIDNNTYELHFSWHKNLNRKNSRSEIILKNIDQKQSSETIKDFSENEYIKEEVSDKKKASIKKILNYSLFLIFVLQCVLILLKWFSIELFLFNFIITDDLIVILLYLFCGIFYSKWVISYFNKSNDKKTLIAGFVPILLSILTGFLVLGIDEMEALVIIPTIISIVMVTAMIYFKFNKKQILYAFVCFLSGTMIFSFVGFFTLFFLPMFNTKYSTYAVKNEKFVKAESGFLAAQWSHIYKKTSPITMIQTKKRIK